MFGITPAAAAPSPGRSTAAETDQRIDLAADLLAEGQDPADVVQTIAEMYGLSVRQAQRIVRRGRARHLIESAPSLSRAIDHGLVDQMVTDVGDHIRLALAEGDRRGAAALLHRWSDLIAKTAPLTRPADAWDRSLASDAADQLPPF